jgi:predicted GH43/DUF377 family glycosyl hydrolase
MYIFIIPLFCFFVVYFYKYKVLYRGKIQSITLVNPINFLKYNSKYVGFNPSVISVNDETYIFWRVAYGQIFSPIKTLIDWSDMFHNYPSQIAITHGNRMIKCNTWHISHYYKEFKNIKYRLCGYEDPRPIQVKNNLYVFVTTFANSAKYPQMGYFTIHIHSLKNDTINCDKFTLINPSLNTNMYQKNWMPLVKDKNLYLIYSIQPFIVYKCDINTGKIELIVNIDYKLNFTVRGGTTAIPWCSERFGDIFLCVAHVRRGMYYTHIFFGLKEDKVICRSDEFIFSKHTIQFVKLKEYCKYFINVQFAAGCMIKNNELYITYGCGNVRGIMCRLDVNILEKIMYKI